MKFILGKKIEMTQLWVGENRKAVTMVEAGPAFISQLKTAERDGYNAVQVCFGQKKAKNINKSILGHLKNLAPARWLKEFRVEAKDLTDLKVGDAIKADTFAVGDKVSVTGWSKGCGFAGVVKRHGFHGQDATHGNKDQLRMPGSIGAGGVQRVFKGVRMPGHMGDQQTTSHNIEIVKIDEEANVIYLAGSVPGARGSLVLLKAAGELKIAQEVVVEETAASTESSVEPKKEPEITEDTEVKEALTVEASEAPAVPEAEMVEENKEVVQEEDATPNT